MGEPGSAGTHSCFMVPFQEELLNLFVFTGSQFVRLRTCACVCASARRRGCRSGGVDLLSLSERHLRKDGGDTMGGDDLRQRIVTLTAAFRSHLTDTTKLELCSLICSFNL